MESFGSRSQTRNDQLGFGIPRGCAIRMPVPKPSSEINARIPACECCKRDDVLRTWQELPWKVQLRSTIRDWDPSGLLTIFEAPFHTTQPPVDRYHPDGADGRRMPLLRLEEYSESACPPEDEMWVVSEPAEAKGKLDELSAPQAVFTTPFTGKESGPTVRTLNRIISGRRSLFKCT